MKTIKISSLLILISIILVSCASIDQKVQILPVDEDIPASASSALYIEGETLLSDDYEVLNEFSFSSVKKEHLNQQDVVPINLNPELKSAVARNDADAITDLKFQLVSVDTSTADWISIEQYIGVLGVCTAGYGIAYQIMQNPDYYTITLAGAAAALAGFGGSFLHSALGTIDYYYEVSGKAVKLRE